jgi:hypothetical protein
MRKAMRYGLAGLLAAGLLTSAPAAFASGGGGGEVIKEGQCSVSSDWKLKAKPDNGGLEVEFEVDQNVVGDTWRVKITDNSNRVFKGKRMTQPPSGSFEVNINIPDLAGKDKIVARATNLSTGETCRGSVSL